MRAAALRLQIEQTLSRRVEAALTPRLRETPDRLPTGIPALDHLLSGGLPEGAISELVGPESSGRTAAALLFTAARLREGRVAAWIDASDTLDPESAAALGVPLEQMLWVRCGDASAGRQTRQEIAHAAPQSPAETLDTRGVSVDRSLSVSSQSGGCGSPHPRSEARGLPEALQTFIGESGPPARTHVGGNRGLVPQRRRDKSIGTPGAANRPLTTPDVDPGSTPAALTHSMAQPPLHWRSPYREEQAPTDRLPARRGDNLPDRAAASALWSPRCAEPQPRRPAAASTATCHLAAGRSNAVQPLTPQQSRQSSAAKHLSPQQHAGTAARTFFKDLSDSSGLSSRRSSSGHLRGIDQALRAADLLLQSNGFAVVVLDLASFPPDLVWRIPLSTWFRFRAAAERSRACLLLLTQHACARSSANVVLDLRNDGFLSSGSVMTGIRWKASVTRERFAAAPSTNIVSIRKPPQSEHPGAWSAPASWTPPSPAQTGASSSAPASSQTLPDPHPSTPHPSSQTPAAAGKLAAFPRRSA